MAQHLMQICEVGKVKDSTVFLSKVLPKIHQIRPTSVSAPISSSVYRTSRTLTDIVFLREFDDKLEIFPSLQRPKKVLVTCSDGVKRAFLCKPKDDIRKDMRFLELASIANTLFNEDRRMQTYAAIPLNEENGIIEWVNNTASLRSILAKLYKEIGITTISFPEFRELQKSANFSAIFAETILTRYYIMSTNDHY